MAGRMSTADFELIKDSINEAIKNFVEQYEEKTTRGGVTQLGEAGWVETRLRRELGESFSSRLKYTNDSFDASRFKSTIIRH
mgnify:CR=1 FL=1